VPDDDQLAAEALERPQNWPDASFEPGLGIVKQQIWRRRIVTSSA
jgi:hypothetical protein